MKVTLHRLHTRLEKLYRFVVLRQQDYIGEVVEKAFENIVDGMLPPLKEDIEGKLDEILKSVGYTKKGDTYVFKGK